MNPGADPTPQRVAENLRSRQADSTATLAAYWLTLNGERGVFQRQLQDLVREDGLVVLIVRTERFDNPDTLMQDLLELMERNRDVLLREAAGIAAGGGRLGLVLLSRRALAMSQSSSPITWPDWVPGAGGRQVVCHIAEVTRRIVAPLNCEECAAWRVNAGLFALEEALIRRLTAVYRRTAGAGEPFFALIKRRRDRPWSGFLAQAAQAAAEVNNDRGFRPERDTGASVISRLWAAAQSRGADDLRELEETLSAALALADIKLLYPGTGMLTILTRRDGSKGTAAQRFARDLVSAVNTACQYVTCVAHYGEYPAYPIILMTSLVDDLHRVLAELEGALNDTNDEYLEHAPGRRTEDR